MKVSHFALLSLLLLLLNSCSSPSGEGAKAATVENQCTEKFINEINGLEQEFTSRFNPDNYEYRAQALEAYIDNRQIIIDNYNDDLNNAVSRNNELKNSYIGDYASIEEFNKSYADNKNINLQTSANELMNSNEVPPAVIRCINNVIPPKPDDTQIIKDLKGHVLREGFEENECFFSRDWSKIIGQDVIIEEFQIENVISNTDREYTFSCKMVLKENCLRYTANVEAYYILPDGKDWTLEIIKSRGVRVIPTHKYDDCIHTYYENKNFFGTVISNISEVHLLVEGYYLSYLLNGEVQKHNFCVHIQAGDKTILSSSAVKILLVEKEF